MAVKGVFGADFNLFDDLEGIEFGEAEGIMRQVLMVPDDVTNVYLNEKQNPDPSRPLRENDEIRFYKEQGKKGN